MSSSSFSASLEEFRKQEKTKARCNYSGGFKYHEQLKKSVQVQPFEQPEDYPMSEGEILKLMGVARPDKQTEILPNRDTLPGNKTELIDQLIGNIEHKIGKIRFLREKELMRQSASSARGSLHSTF